MRERERERERHRERVNAMCSESNYQHSRAHNQIINTGESIQC